MRMTTKIRAICWVVALSLIPTGSNASLESRLPLYDKASSPASANLVLTFPTDVDLSGTKVELLDSHMHAIPTERLEFSGSRSDVSVPLRVPLNPGAYTVNWRARAVDGRESHGSYSFDVSK